MDYLTERGQKVGAEGEVKLRIPGTASVDSRGFFNSSTKSFEKKNSFISKILGDRRISIMIRTWATILNEQQIYAEGIV